MDLATREFVGLENKKITQLCLNIQAGCVKEREKLILSCWLLKNGPD